MILRLIVMRHAKSSWKELGQSDHERPLTARGRRAAPQVAHHLAEIGWVPDKIISSDSLRTRETAGLLSLTWHLATIEFTDSFYLTGPDAVREILSSLASNLRTLLILGHNHGWEDVVHWLSGETVTLKTASAALLTCTADSWEEALATPNRWQLVDLVHPRDLED